MRNATVSERLRRVASATGRVVFRPVPSRLESAVVFAAIAILFLFVFGPALRAGFYVIEDHLLLAGRTWGVSNWIDRIVGDVQGFQRFRPAYWAYHAVGVQLFGSNPHLWHFAAMVWGVLTCYLLYDAMRNLGADIISSLIFVLVMVVGGSQSWIWLNLIPQETIGMLWTAVAVWALVRAARSEKPGPWDALALVAMAIAGLVKESFVVLIPALLLLRLTADVSFSGLTWRDSLRRARIPLGAGVIVFAIEIIVVVTILVSKADGYSATASGISVASFDPRRWLGMVSTLGLSVPLLLTAAICVGLWFWGGVRGAHLLRIAVVFAAWLIPQLIIYSNGFTERYLFPAMVGIAAMLAAALSISWRRKLLWPVGVLGVLLLLPVLSNGVKSTTQTVSWLTAETVAANRMVEFIAQNIPADKTILIAGDSGTGYGFEATHSLPLYLKEAGSRSPTYLWPLLSKGARSAIHIAASGNNTAFRYPESLMPGDVGAIILVDTFVPALDSRPLVRWLGDTRWREISFTEAFHSFSPVALRYDKAGELRHTVLLPATSSAVPSGRPLFAVDATLNGIVAANPLLETPGWGLEPDPSGAGSVVWVGQGDAEGLGGALSSRRAASVALVVDVVPGPSRTDSRRNVELQVDNSLGQSMQRQVFEGGQWKFSVELQPGANFFRLRVLDEPTVQVQPNGDTRRLLALVRRIAVR